jgi:hypothetical protein
LVKAEEIAEAEFSKNVEKAIKSTKNVLKVLETEVRMHVEEPWDDTISYGEMIPITYKETLRALNNLTLERYKKGELKSNKLFTP